MTDIAKLADTLTPAQRDAREFHWKDSIYFRRSSTGDVEIVKRPNRAAYWTQEKGFHNPEMPVLTIDAGSWDSIVSFLANDSATGIDTPSDPLDECECGDYRRDHPNDGPCTFNRTGFDLVHANTDCPSFRLAVRAHLMENDNG